MSGDSTPRVPMSPPFRLAITGSGPGGGNHTISGGAGNDRLWGQNDNDLVTGANGNDHVDGGYGNDRVHGDNGNDKVLGGAGIDRLRGGDGRDRFVFDGGDSGAGNRDIVEDFQRGECMTVNGQPQWVAGDVIDLPPSTPTRRPPATGLSPMSARFRSVAPPRSAARRSTAPRCCRSISTPTPPWRCRSRSGAAPCRSPPT